MKFGSSWKIQSPCNGCADRFVGCHGGCDKYGQYQRKLYEFKSKIVKQKREEGVADSFTVKSMVKQISGKIYER